MMLFYVGGLAAVKSFKLHPSPLTATPVSSIMPEENVDESAETSFSAPTAAATVTLGSKFFQ